MEMEDNSSIQKENEKSVSELQRAKGGIEWDPKGINFLHNNLTALEDKYVTTADRRSSVKIVRRQRRKLNEEKVGSSHFNRSSTFKLGGWEWKLEGVHWVVQSVCWQRKLSQLEGKHADQQFQWQKTSTQLTWWLLSNWTSHKQLWKKADRKTWKKLFKKVESYR